MEIDPELYLLCSSTNGIQADYSLKAVYAADEGVSLISGINCPHRCVTAIIELKQLC